MPELPEVETTRKGLEQTVIGLRINGFWSDTKNMCVPSIEAVRRGVVGSQIQKAERQGKNLLIHLSNQQTLLIHLKMTGHLMYGTYVQNASGWTPNDANKALYDPYNRFIHAVFSLQNGKALVFCDARKFGKIEILDTAKVNLHARLSALGPEPIAHDFTLQEFDAKLSKTKRTIKQTLLDQTVFAGVGNIYADESLFRASIHPLRNTSSLTLLEKRLLYKAIREVLQSGVDFGGDSTSDYRNIFGERGAFHGKHKVYRRTGLPCTKQGCTGTIERIVVGGRGTHFCPICQIYI